MSSFNNNSSSGGGGGSSLRRNSSEYAGNSDDEGGEYMYEGAGGVGGVGGVVGSAGKTLRRGMNNLTSGIHMRGRGGLSDDEGGEGFGQPAIVGASLALTRGAAGAAGKVFSSVRRGAGNVVVGAGNVVAGAARVVVGNEGGEAGRMSRMSFQGNHAGNSSSHSNNMSNHSGRANARSGKGSSKFLRSTSSATDYDDPVGQDDEDGKYDNNNKDHFEDHDQFEKSLKDGGDSSRNLMALESGERSKARKSSASDAFARRRAGGVSKDRKIGAHDANILDTLPLEYRYNPRTATPVLHYLPRVMAAVAARNSHEPIQLRSLLKAAQGDIRLHRARVQAALERDMKLIRTYQLDHDPRYKERLQRLQERKEMIAELRHDKDQILKDLKDGAAGTNISGLTQSESAQLQLVRWQRALELYVYDTSRDHFDADDDDFYPYNTHNNPSLNSDLLNWQSVFEKLLDGISEDQDIAQILMQASEMCQKLVRETEKAVDDAAQYMADLESAYVIRLEAHEMFARSSLQQVAYIEEQFRTAGQAALRIGHQLENAEMKRSQCDAASILIRRWWIMESLALQEAQTGETIPVEMEMNGGITPNACRLDHLFTKRENSLEASKALKQLRAVVLSRGNAAAGGANGAGAAIIIDKSGSKRLDLTSNLIARVSDALEERLLNQFGIVYNAGGNYDFSLKPRPGAIDWRELRSLAQALLLFDSGRNLHKRYVEMVLENRFPELFDRSKQNRYSTSGSKKNNNDLDVQDVAESMKDANLNTFDMDATRTKLSTLFHRVSEVCTAEFELIAHVFSADSSVSSSAARTDILDGSEEMPLVVARALLQRVISDPQHGLQARVNDLLASIDRHGDFESGAKKLDTFVIIQEKAASLFGTLKDAADRMMLTADHDTVGGTGGLDAVESLKGFLTSQQLALGNQHRQSYINLELRLLHHDCCACLDQAGCTLVKGPPARPDNSLAEKGILEEYRAPVLPLHKASLEKAGFTGLLTKPLKPAVLRQPLIHANNSITRARQMFGTGHRGGETMARVILGIYNQMCSFYGKAYLYPVLEVLKEMLPRNAPNQPPQLPFNEDEDAHDLGVSPAFWVALERIHSAAKSFDRELWAENATHNTNTNTNSPRVFETLDDCGDPVSLNFARSERTMFYSELERRGESAILKALDTISTHVQWILVTGGESMLATGGTRMLGQLTGGSAGGPYAIPPGSSLETPNSPAVKALTYCLRVQFVHIQAALTSQSLSNFWTALSMRLYDILVARLLQCYSITTVGAVILSRDVEALRSVAMLSGTEHSHWDLLRELLTLYMTPPDAIKGLLIGSSDGSGGGVGSGVGAGSGGGIDATGKGLFQKVGKDKCMVFLSRRHDYRYKTTSGLKKNGWVIDMLTELRVTDPTDGKINIGLFAAGRKT